MKNKEKAKTLVRERRRKRTRARITGTNVRPRVFVFRSNKHIYAQIVDDERGVTLVSSSDWELGEDAKGKKADIASRVGERLAEKAKTKRITNVVFDKRHYAYHGRVKALAEGARKGGLRF